MKNSMMFNFILYTGRHTKPFEKYICYLHTIVYCYHARPQFE